MAVTCTSDSNVTSATCWLCYTQSQMWGMQMLLLCNAINGDTMDCDPSTILSGATDEQPRQESLSLGLIRNQKVLKG